MRTLTVVVSFFISIGSVWAAEQCVIVETSGWTPNQRTLRESMSHALLYDQGCNAFDDPLVSKFRIEGDQICVTGCALDITTILTAQAILNRITVEDTARATRKSLQDALVAEETSLQTDIDAALANWANLNTAQRLDALRKSMRLLRVEAELR